MADITITVRIASTVNGRKFVAEETCLVEDVYDIGVIAHGTAPEVASAEYSGTAGYVNVAQNNPSTLAIINASIAQTSIARIRLDDGGNTDRALFALLPGAFLLIHEHTNGSGLAAIDATTQTGYDDVLVADLAQLTMPGTIDGRIITINTAAS